MGQSQQGERKKIAYVFLRNSKCIEGPSQSNMEKKIEEEKEQNSVS